MKICAKFLLSVLPLMLLSAAFGGCNHYKKNSEINEDFLKIDKNYRIITPEGVGVNETKIASELCKRFREKYVGFELKQDYYKDPNEIEAYEILVGDTNRIESQIDVPETNEYTVRVVEKKIVIKAGSIIALDSACGYFYDFVAQNDFLIPKDFQYNGVVDFSSDKKIMVADQSNGGVAILDVSNPYQTPIIENFVSTMHARVAGLKYRETSKYGKVILSCNGSANAQIISYPEMKTLWRTGNAASNPHSVEITPDGKIFAVASSTGGAVRFYNTDLQSTKFFELPFPNAHGVLYDEVNKWFWITGNSTLCAYTANPDDLGNIIIKEVEGKRFTLPTTSSHDLQAVSGKSDKLWISTYRAVYLVDKSTGECSLKYDHNSEINLKAVKGISNFADGTFTLVTPDGLLESWTSSKVICSYRLDFSNQQYFVVHALPNNTHIYKVRAFISDYSY